MDGHVYSFPLTGYVCITRPPDHSPPSLWPGLVTRVTEYVTARGPDRFRDVHHGRFCVSVADSSAGDATEHFG